MASILVRTRVESDTLRIPELSSFIGKNVDVYVTEARAEEIDPAWRNFFDNAAEDTIDLNAVIELRQASMT
ncbi:MAG: hypothetical protein GHCLOJNM_01717 [bacterium]|nr:hypothetical protein [bacterium]